MVNQQRVLFLNLIVLYLIVNSDLMMSDDDDDEVPDLDSCEQRKEAASYKARSEAYRKYGSDDDDDDESHPDDVPDLVEKHEDRKKAKKINLEPDEVEPVPAWIRYMPKNLQQKPKIDDAIVLANEVRMDMQLEPLAPPAVPVPVLVPIKPSSNRFGPTSLKAKSQKRSRSSSSAPYAQDEQRTSSQRLKDRLNRCNVNEAAMLFSMSGIAKK